jgi:hypothetical protein
MCCARCSFDIALMAQQRLYAAIPWPPLRQQYTFVSAIAPPRPPTQLPRNCMSLSLRPHWISHEHTPHTRLGRDFTLGGLSGHVRSNSSRPSSSSSGPSIASETTEKQTQAKQQQQHIIQYDNNHDYQSDNNHEYRSNMIHDDQSDIIHQHIISLIIFMIISLILIMVGLIIIMIISLILFISILSSPIIINLLPLSLHYTEITVATARMP